MLHTVTLSKIVILPNRQRQEFEPEALQELKNSIEDRGLMHPPVLRTPTAADAERFPEIDFTDKMILVAGERRLKAIEEIFLLGGQFTCNRQVCSDGLIPFTTLGELSELEAEEAELDENLKRRDLTWQEHAAAVKRLHELRESQKREAAAKVLADPSANALDKLIASAPVKAFQSIADTAEELTGRRDGSYQDNIRKEILVAKHLDNPVIAKAKSADEAFKLLKRLEEQAKNRELAAVVGKSFNSSNHVLLNINCIAWMSKPEVAELFDVILTDPPYGMGAHTFGDGGGKFDGIEHHYDDSYEAWLLLMTGIDPITKDRLHEGWCNLSYKIAKPQAHAYVFCDIDRFHELKSFMESAGWYVFRTPLINVKSNSGRVPLPDQGPRRQYEILLYAIKGKKPVTHIYPDVITTTADENMTHGAQKPVALYQNLLQRSVRPGDSVIDTFAGTGPIFPAANTLQCYAHGLEQNPEYFAMSFKRLEALKQADQLTLEL